jgi:hypothetical protein
VLSRFKARYTQWACFDDQEYINLNDPAVLPWNVVEPFEPRLPSDSSRRRDIQLLKEKQIEQSQEEKERLENEERFFRKLREQHTK